MDYLTLYVENHTSFPRSLTYNLSKVLAKEAWFYVFPYLDS